MRQTTPIAPVSVDDVVDSYWKFLSRNNYTGHLRRFKHRLESDPKAAEAEAVAFSVLWSEKLRPDIFEDLNAGGPDFRCAPSANESFLVEVASLDSTSVSNKSGLPLELTGAGGQAFSLITRKLRSTAQGKAAQLAGYDLPRVLAITSAHDFAGILMDRGAAEHLMISDPHLRVPLHPTGGASYFGTDLDHAVFCRPSIFDASGDPTVAPCCQSISAILLVTILAREVNIVGLLHPAPAQPFNPQLLSRVPYVRFRQWPIMRGKVEIEWILGEEQYGSAMFDHKRIR
jgi:hypothetical protein